MSSQKLFRLVTVPLSFKHLIKGQPNHFASKGFKVKLFAADGPERNDVENYEGVPYHVVDMTREITPVRDLNVLKNLIAIFKKEKPDIVHTQTPKAGLLGMMAARMAGIPKRIHTVGGLPILEAEGIKKRILNATEKMTSACATQVLVNSHKLAEIMVEKSLCPANKLHVLGFGSSNGIDTEYFSPGQIPQSKNELRAEWSIPPDGFVFVFIGRIVKDKGINELAAAFEALSGKHPHIYLLLVGPEERHLDPVKEETISMLKNNPKVFMTGYQPDVRPYLKMSNVLVFPSYREGFPNVPLQAGAFGLPAIVSDINGCNEIIFQGKNGWIIPSKNETALRNAMEFAIENPEEVIAAGLRARPFIEKYFSQQFIWNEIEKVYRSPVTFSLEKPKVPDWDAL